MGTLKCMLLEETPLQEGTDTHTYINIYLYRIIIIITLVFLIIHYES